MRNVLLRCLLVVSLLAPVAASAQTGAEGLHKFFERVFEQQLADQPEFATTIGRHEYDDRWSDLSKAGRERRRTHLQAALDELHKFPTNSLSSQDRLSLRLLDYQLKQDLEAFDLETYLLRMTQVFGLHNRVYTTFDRMPAHSLRDYQSILARLRAIPGYVDQNIALLNDALQRGLVQPKVVVDLVTKQISAQAAQEDATSPILIPFRHFPSSFSADQQGGDARLLPQHCEDHRAGATEPVQAYSGAVVWGTRDPYGSRGSYAHACATTVAGQQHAWLVQSEYLSA